MKLRTSFVLGLFVVFLASATQSRADSDAYFCSSKGYLAYETRAVVTPGAVGHVLRVVRFEPKRGIYSAGEVTLLDFQVQHLICSEDHIEISGSRNYLFTKYVVEIAKSGELRSIGPTEHPEREWPDASDGPEPMSLDVFGPHVAPLPLESTDPQHKYQLLRNLTSRKIKGGLQWHSKSEILQLDLSGTILQRFVLYERRTIEPSD